MTALTEFLLARFDDDVTAIRLTHCERCLSYQHAPDDPETERLLADVGAKRRIVAGCVESQYRWILSELAVAYADHPDYRQEWKP